MLTIDMKQEINKLETQNGFHLLKSIVTIDDTEAKRHEAIADYLHDQQMILEYGHCDKIELSSDHHGLQDEGYFIPSRVRGVLDKLRDYDRRTAWQYKNQVDWTLYRVDSAGHRLYMIATNQVNHV